MSLPDLAWCAGIVDGEGHFGVKNDGYVFLSVAQCDREMLDRLVVHLGGVVNGPYERTGHERWRPIWNYHLHGLHPVRAVTEQMWPWLGTVKREQYLAVIEKAKVIAPAGYCRKGLHLMDENRTPTEKRCRPCRNERINNKRKATV